MKQIDNWRKSVYSGSQASCVEVGTAGTVLGVRDSKDKAGPALGFTATAWGSFIDKIKAS